MKKNLIVMWILRLITAAALSIFLIRALAVWQAAPTITLSLLILGECVTLVIYLSARHSKETTFSLISIVSTLCGTFYFLLVVLDRGQALAPLWITVSMQVFGITWQIVAKLYLGRSFGLLPANRGIVTQGPYRVVRHPIYLGYFIAHVGFLMGSFNWSNVFLFCALYFFQALRIVEEERLLKNDPDYLRYYQKTRYRFIPGLI